MIQVIVVDFGLSGAIRGWIGYLTVTGESPTRGEFYSIFFQIGCRTGFCSGPAAPPPFEYELAQIIMLRPNFSAYAMFTLAFVLSTFVSSAANAQQFGGAAAIIGGDVFAGYVQSTDISGIVHVYRDVDGKWIEVAKLSASDADGMDDRFGRALAASEGRLYAGATTRKNSSGAVYVFDTSADGQWRESQLLAPASVKEGDSFGRSIAVAGDHMFVGAAGTDSLTGAVYLYTRNASGKWMESARFQPEDLMQGDLFGLNVAASDNHALIITISPGNEDRNPQVYAYNRTGADWTSMGTLPSTDYDEQLAFGLVTAASGSRAFVGGQGLGERGGVLLYTFDTSKGEWSYDGILFSGDEDGEIGFGASLTVANGSLYVGAPGAEDGVGRVYVYPLDVLPSTKPTDTIIPPSDLSNFGSVLAVNDKFLIAGNPSADFGLGRVGVLEQKADADWTFATEIFQEMDGMASVSGEQVRCHDGDAAGFGCQKVDLLSFMPVADLGGGRGARTSDVWGWTDPVTEKDYALVGRMDGTSFVDISDPYNPVLIGNLPMTDGAQANMWRDIKVYKDHAYVVADGAGDHGMQVFDLRQLRDVQNIPATFSENVLYDKIASAHNIVINEESGFAYAVGSNSGGETCAGGSHMIDIRDPQNPKFAGCFAHEGTGRTGTGYTHDAQCVEYAGPDTRYSGQEVCFGANETALSIADVTDKDSTVTLSSAEYPNVGYAHQGWLTEDHRYFLLNDELDELSGLTDGTRTLIWDVSDLEDPQLIKEYVSDVKSSDHNLYIKGNLVYQSNYVSGLRILDISDIMNPVEAGHFDTVPGESNDPGFDGSWSNYPFFKSGVIVVTSGSEGLFLVKKSDLGL